MFISIYQDLRPEAVDGPGWYVNARNKQGQVEVLSSMRLAASEVQRIAELVDELSQGKPVHRTAGLQQANITVTEGVLEGNNEIKQVLSVQLKEAEETAARIARLRKGLAEYAD